MVVVVISECEKCMFDNVSGCLRKKGKERKAWKISSSAGIQTHDPSYNTGMGLCQLSDPSMQPGAGHFVNFL